MAQTQARALPGAVLSPTGLAGSPVVGGGTFAALTYFWKITWVTDWGESEASNEITNAVALNGSETLTWTVPTVGAPVRSVNIYRGTATNAEVFIANVPETDAGIVPATYLDTGTAGTAQTPPAVTSFANVTLLADGMVSSADTIIGALPNPAMQLQALQAANEWQNGQGPSGSLATEAQDMANAAGLALNWA
jgi:hypothetical protein